MSSNILVRPVQRSDLLSLAELEQNVWGPLGTPVLSFHDMECWFEESSPFFLIAERNGIVCGSYFGRRVSFTEKESIGYLNPEHHTGVGYCSNLHEPNGQNLYGINILSNVPGAGRALYDAVFSLKEKLAIKYSIAFTRLSGFDRYVRTHLPDCETSNLDTLALWYAHESTELLQQPKWPEYSTKPLLGNRPLQRPDAMLAFHMKGTRFGLIGVMPNYMSDPRSRNYGALVLSKHPHR